jgi:hypothetical protein
MGRNKTRPQSHWVGKRPTAHVPFPKVDCRAESDEYRTVGRPTARVPFPQIGCRAESDEYRAVGRPTARVPSSETDFPPHVCKHYMWGVVLVARTTCSGRPPSRYMCNFNKGLPAEMSLVCFWGLWFGNSGTHHM